MFTQKIEEIFKGRSAKDERLFQLLPKAYVDTDIKTIILFGEGIEHTDCMNTSLASIAQIHEPSI